MMPARRSRRRAAPRPTPAPLHPFAGAGRGSRGTDPSPPIHDTRSPPAAVPLGGPWRARDAHDPPGAADFLQSRARGVTRVKRRPRAGRCRAESPLIGGSSPGGVCARLRGGRFGGGCKTSTSNASQFAPMAPAAPEAIRRHHCRPVVRLDVFALIPLREVGSGEDGRWLERNRRAGAILTRAMTAVAFLAGHYLRGEFGIPAECRGLDGEDLRVRRIHAYPEPLGPRGISVARTAGGRPGTDRIGSVVRSLILANGFRPRMWVGVLEVSVQPKRRRVNWIWRRTGRACRY